jgi:hypothetical protein
MDARAVRRGIELGLPLVLVAAFLVVASLDAVALPYHDWDALAYGEWSRLIAEHWRLDFPQATAAEYQRPVLYVLQGVAWGVFGFSEQLGRIVDLGFGIALVAAVFVLGRHVRGVTCGAVCATLVLLVPAAQAGFTSGLTDVPVSATVALAGVAAFAGAPVLLVVASCAAMLTKSSALPALAGLALACAVGIRGPDRARATRLVGAVAAGTGIALVYDEIQAARLHMGLLGFLRSGSDGYYTQLAVAARRSAIFDEAWLGEFLRMLVLFALVYGIARAIDVGHRRGAWTALLAAPILSYGGPLIATHFDRWQVGPLGSWRHALGALALLVALGATTAAPETVVPPVDLLRRLVVWGLPPLAVWAWYGGYDLRLLSPAWPALIVLSGVVLHSAFESARGRGIALAVPAAVAVAITAAAGLEYIDGMTPNSWRSLQQAPTGFFDLNANRRLLLPSFADVLAAVRPDMTGSARMISSDGMFRFFFPGRVAQTYPRTCSDLRGYDVYVYLGDPESVAYMQSQGIDPDLGHWSACADPKLTQITQVDTLTAFRVAGTR